MKPQQLGDEIPHARVAMRASAHAGGQGLLASFKLGALGRLLALLAGRIIDDFQIDASRP